MDNNAESGGCVWINQHQYFENVSAAVWEYQVGRYQDGNRWLDERVGRKIIYDEISTFGRLVGSIEDTLPVLDAIEDALAEAPRWE